MLTTIQILLLAFILFAISRVVLRAREKIIMKILMVTEFFPTGKDLRFSGGVEAGTYFVAKHLAKKHQVCVITSRDLTSPKVEKMFGFTVYRTGPRRSYIATAGDLLKRI